MPDGVASKQVEYLGVSISLRENEKKCEWRVFFSQKNFPRLGNREFTRKCGTENHPATLEKKQGAFNAALVLAETKTQDYIRAHGEALD